MPLSFFVLGCVLSFLGTFLAVRFFPKIGLLDFPERYGLSRPRIPYPGGLVFCLFALFLPLLDWSFLPLSLAVLGIGIVSFYDDLKPLSATIRVCIYGAIITAFFFLGINIEFIGDPFSGTNIELPRILSFLITLVWVLSIQQSLNWFDGIRGLSIGMGAIGFFFLGILGLIHPELFFDPHETTSVWANFFLSGLCIGGWWYFFKGKILLGDTGAQVLGFLLAIMSIFTGAKVGTTLLILAFPMLDTIAVVFRRIFIEKHSPLKGDQKHIHHNLMHIFGEKKAVGILLSLSILLGVLGTSLKGFSKLVAVVFVSIAIIAFIIWSFRQKNS